MADYFAVFGFDPQPWLDQEELKTRFHQIAADTHPDHLENADTGPSKPAFTELNTAYQCLREPASRLLHFLELELGKKPENVRNIPGELTDMFSVVGELCRSIDHSLSVRETDSSPLIKVASFERAQIWSERVQDVQKRLSARMEELHQEVQRLNEEWLARERQVPKTGAQQAMLVRLIDVWQLLTYYARWLSQLKERQVQLLT